MNIRFRSLTPPRAVSLGLILATLLWIWTHSMIPRAASAEESNRVAEWLAQWFPAQTPFGVFLQINVRKIAHFTEYAVLGAQVAVAARLFEVPPRVRLFDAFFGLCVGFMDETIQIFSGRGPAITDVWIDCFGYLFLYLPLCLLLCCRREK